jgi:hypothetical protein
MPLPNEKEIELLGPIIQPFGRNNRTDKVKKIGKGEDILYDLESGAYDATSDGYPDNSLFVSTEEFDLLISDCPKYRDLFINKKYLWVIGVFGLRMIRELTRNEARKGKKYVCHTNLTGGLEAYQGGEVWFCEDGRVGINYFSDRYGATSIIQWNAVINHFKSVGYDLVFELYKFKDK